MTKAYEERMVKAVAYLESEYASVRAGRANPGVLDKVTVDYYGVPTPINQVASVSVTEARTLSIQPWDRTLLKAITKAIHKLMIVGLFFFLAMILVLVEWAKIGNNLVI